MEKDDIKNYSDQDVSPKVDKQASKELEKSFGLGVAKKSFMVSRGFSLNEIVKAGK